MPPVGGSRRGAEVRLPGGGGVYSLPRLLGGPLLFVLRQPFLNHAAVQEPTRDAVCRLRGAVRGGIALDRWQQILSANAAAWGLTKTAEDSRNILNDYLLGVGLPSSSGSGTTLISLPIQGDRLEAYSRKRWAATAQSEKV